jgi:repressor LexA
MKTIAKWRKKNKMTQTALAARLGVSTSTVAMWETGQRNPNYKALLELSRLFGVSLEELLGVDKSRQSVTAGRVRPVLGYVRAGGPNLAQEEILGYEPVTEKMAESGDYYFLTVRGDSMEPVLKQGDIVLVHSAAKVRNGDLAVVKVGIDEATIKKVQFKGDNILLIPFNPRYDYMNFTRREAESLPVVIMGRVEESRRKYV